MPGNARPPARSHRATRLALALAVCVAGLLFHRNQQLRKTISAQRVAQAETGTGPVEHIPIPELPPAPLPPPPLPPPVAAEPRPAPPTGQPAPAPEPPRPADAPQQAASTDPEGDRHQTEATRHLTRYMTTRYSIGTRKIIPATLIVTPENSRDHGGWGRRQNTGIVRFSYLDGFGDQVDTHRRYEVVTEPWRDGIRVIETILKE